VIDMQSILVFSASGPLLVLSTHETIDDPGLSTALRDKGLEKFLACEVPLERCRQAYGFSYRQVAVDLEQEEVEGIRILDYDGHHIFAALSLLDLGRGVVSEDGIIRAAA
jgi:hypothetical protein